MGLVSPFWGTESLSVSTLPSQEGGSSLPWVTWLKAGSRSESEVMGPRGRSQGLYKLHEGRLRLLRAASAHSHWPSSRQRGLADDPSDVLTSCLSRSDGKVILFVLPY